MAARISKILRRAKTERALHVHNLAEESLLKLTLKPLELTSCLTEHAAVTADVGIGDHVPGQFGYANYLSFFTIFHLLFSSE